jgi:hypothetical protein
MMPSILTSCRHGRRGSVYILVLGTGMLLTVVGLSVLTLARLNGRTILWANNSKEARVLAEAAVEWALTKLADDANWRTTYTNGVETAPVALGHGTISFKLVDEIDGNLANIPTDPVRIYGSGRAGAATRIYSAKLVPNGLGLDVLKTVAHAGGNLSTTQKITGIRGYFSSNGMLIVPLGAEVNGDVEAPILFILGTVNGARRTVAAKAMPSPNVFDDYLATATEIPFASLSGGAIQNAVLSPAANPYGSVNAKGVYHIRVPAGASLSLQYSRLVATLLVTLESGAHFTTSNAWLMEPPQPDFPTLLIRCLGTGATVNLDGTSSQLSESGRSTNFNPPGTPYPWPSGTADSDLVDQYRPRFMGLLHVICPPTVTTNLGNAFTACGTVLAEGPMVLGNKSSLRTDLSLYVNPPIGYRMPGPMVPVAGSWRWEKAP